MRDVRYWHLAELLTSKEMSPACVFEVSDEIDKIVNHLAWRIVGKKSLQLISGCREICGHDGHV